MSSRLPRVSGRQLVRLLERLGYYFVRQCGSHIRMRKESALGEHSITIPAHREIASGTLNDILNQVSLWNNIPKERIVQMVRES